ARTPLVRGLVLGILGAFAGGGVVVGTAKFYALSLGGGDATIAILFAALFVGLGLGIAAGPRDRKSTRLNSSHLGISYAVFGWKKTNRNTLSSGSAPPVWMLVAPTSPTT